MTLIDAYRIDPESMLHAWSGEAPPLAIVDLNRLDPDRGALRLPPFPVIHIGDPAHPAAWQVDAVVQSPAMLRRIVERVTACPLAAGTAVQVLRATEALAPEQALACESIAYAMLQGSAEHCRWLAARAPAVASPPGRIVLDREAATLRITIDRPHARNAIDRASRDALFAAFALAEADPDIVRVALRAVGPAFGIGAELAEFGTTRDPATAHAIRCLTLPAHPLSRCARKVDVHVQGACIGAALEMAAFAGRVTASPRAWFQLPELTMGIIPGAGGCVSVPRRIGRQRAALMILSGRRIDAATALDWRLIDVIVDEPPVDPGGAHADRG